MNRPILLRTLLAGTVLGFTGATIALEKRDRPSLAAAIGGPTEVTVVVENLAPDGGTYLTPVWVGFHDGTFDLYDLGDRASAELERLAEDGNTGPLSDAFTMSGAGDAQATIAADAGIPPLAPGETATMTFTLDGDSRASRYFSYASMVIPSNDAFIANGKPAAHRIFNPGGRFMGADFVVFGTAVRDAGSELNDEDPTNTAFFGQMAPDTGLDECAGVRGHGGYRFAGCGGILDAPEFAEADFLGDGYPVARITVTASGGGDDGHGD